MFRFVSYSLLVLFSTSVSQVLAIGLRSIKYKISVIEMQRVQRKHKLL